ncbi:hypothetical protein TWF730_005361 [Orbilia blumenaviensis]|uniref:Uncharacterized protein n=1 Tax=Orbilia blumenaviensis TaxID=1796055 RepID=A0AAV9VJB7_9PEZI
MCHYDMHHYLVCNHQLFSPEPASLCKTAKKRTCSWDSESEMPCVGVKTRSRNRIVRFEKACPDCLGVYIWDPIAPTSADATTTVASVSPLEPPSTAGVCGPQGGSSDQKQWRKKEREPASPKKKRTKPEGRKVLSTEETIVKNMHDPEVGSWTVIREQANAKNHNNAADPKASK